MSRLVEKLVKVSWRQVTGDVFEARCGCRAGETLVTQQDDSYKWHVNRLVD